MRHWFPHSASHLVLTQLVRPRTSTDLIQWANASIQVPVIVTAL